MAKNIFLKKDWQNSHLRQIKEQAGPRYRPELNVDLPITETFDSISRTGEFYRIIRENYRILRNEFNHISGKYENEDAKRTYQNLKDRISFLFTILEEIKEYSIERIPWSEISKYAKEASEASERLLNILSELEERKYNWDINLLHKTAGVLGCFNDFSESPESRLSNAPFLLLIGDAGAGKTHLLCDLVEGRTEKALPAMLVFGESFETTDSPFAQIIKQLKLGITESQFLRLLNNSGKQSRCRAVLAIDALNETRIKSFWKANLKEIVDKLKRYPNIALLVSVRTRFEKEVIRENLRGYFTSVRHQGFEFKEWEAVNKFFNEFRLPIPEIPLLIPEFQNPLFLLLFCKAFEARERKVENKGQRQVFRGHEGATYIFESFVKRASKKISNKFGISRGPHENIWDTIIEKMAEEMVENHSDSLSEEQVLSLVQKAYPEIASDELIKELESNLIVVKVPKYSIKKDGYVEFKFPYQKFSDHLRGRYIFKKWRKELDEPKQKLGEAKEFFSRRNELGKFSDGSGDLGIIETLSVQCPENVEGYEFMEVAPHFANCYSAHEAFIESLIWRKPDAFSLDKAKTLEYIGNFVRTEIRREEILNALLAVASLPDHPLNADFLHKNLSNFSMSNRDSWWSTFLHEQQGKRKAVDRLIEWGWSGQDKTNINEENIRLCSVALCWFLTTSNRIVRDKATKSLVALLTGRLTVVLKLLEKFKDVNDPYVAERLYAVAYGCAIRTRNKEKELKSLALWVYTTIFKQANPPAHILLRDYARGIIEVALHQKIKLEIDRGKIEPPFNSEWSGHVPSEEALKREYHLNIRKNESANRGVTYIMNDFGIRSEFGNYVFDSNVRRWTQMRLRSQNSSHRNMEDLSTLFDTDLARRWCFNKVMQLGWHQELHGEFDDEIHCFRTSASREMERIGKKYQWIALYELLARISDNFVFGEGVFADRIKEYRGHWQLNMRGIDSSCTLKKFPNEKPRDLPIFNNSNIRYQPKAWKDGVLDANWLQKAKDLPNPKRIIESVSQEKTQWVMLQGSINWEKEHSPEHEGYVPLTSTLWYVVRSYLVHKENRNEIFNWAKKQDFMHQQMPASHEFHHACLGEYPWAQMFLHNYGGWEKITAISEGKISSKVLVTDDECSISEGGSDYSVDGPIKVKLPAKFLMDEMELVQSYVDGRCFNRSGNLVAFDPSVFSSEMPQCVLMRKDKLIELLERNDYALLWTLYGGKYMLRDSGAHEFGQLVINGAYTLNEKNEIIGSKKCHFIEK